MQSVPKAFEAFKQFILWKNIDGKKVPIHYLNGRICDAHNPENQTDYQTAAIMAEVHQCGIGFSFTEKDPFFFLDIDKCLNPDNTWSQLAVTLMNMLPGAYVEISQSGNGLHIFGTGIVPEGHANKNTQLGIELYTKERFVALTGTSAVGDAMTDCSIYIPLVISNYFQPKFAGGDFLWSDEPVDEWDGPTTDEELLEKALKSGGAATVFGNKVSFRDLWEANEDALAKAYPTQNNISPYDASSADAALAQHLAFWTGKNCERILSLMMQSELRRDKWEREKYIKDTILKACSIATMVYGQKTENQMAEKFGAVKLRSNSNEQRVFAESIRERVLQNAAPHDAEILAKIPTARQWIENKDKTAEEFARMVTPVHAPVQPITDTATIVFGYQYLGADQQIEYFKGCVYIQDAHRILTPSGALLKPDQFKATYGGYTFQLDESGDKTTRNAWEAFTESQIVRWPIAESTCFRPDQNGGAIIKMDGRSYVNTYVPITTPRRVGDASPFINHMALLLPDERDRMILTSYMAACVQYKGYKFQWCPLVQGAEGNGKSLLTRCVAFAIGDKYTHFPPANEIAEKFNAWLFDKLFIGVEDIYVADNKREVLEVLKPMITNNKLAKRAMQQDQITADVCANFILNSNHKDAIRKTRNDRRFAVFYTAQQTDEDIIKSGMGGDYFPNLYTWLRSGGYEIVSEYLHTFPIPDELNPATLCHRAPETSSTNEAVFASVGSIEQEILEAIAEGRIGFANGWVSSIHVSRLLDTMRAGRAIPHNKRKELMEGLGYIYHPALHEGRVNNPVAIDDNKKPRLFIKKGHINCNIKTPADVVRIYQEDQMHGATGESKAGLLFKQA